MSKSKIAISEIKKLMVQFGFMSDESTLKSFKLEDNTIVETLELKAGEKITKVNDEFNRVALESGSYRLVENFNIEVVDGEIKSVKEIFVSAKLVDGTEIKVEGEELDQETINGITEKYNDIYEKNGEVTDQDIEKIALEYGPSTTYGAYLQSLIL
jgi:hypothetical protein